MNRNTGRGARIYDHRPMNKLIISIRFPMNLITLIGLSPRFLKPLKIFFNFRGCGQESLAIRTDINNQDGGPSVNSMYLVNDGL